MFCGSNYKNNKKIMLCKKIKKEWENFINNEKYTKYFMSNEEEWLYNLEKAIFYIDTNNKRPSSYNGKNEDVTKLGKWINNQQHNYKNNKQIMLCEKIKKEWENFINNEKYAKYFMSNEE
jgi:hypothetical protein